MGCLIMTTLNDYVKQTKICVFCETVCSPESVFCFLCNEYKGLMTLDEFDKHYGYLNDTDL